MKNPILFLIAFLSFNSNLYSEKNDLKAKIQRAFQDKATPGLLVGYADSHQAFSLAFGLADVDKKEALTEEHLMMSGSTGKIVVAAAVLQLVRKKKLQLDDPIDQYLDKSWSDLVSNFECLTIRHLLQHRSGIQRYIFTDFRQVVRQNADRVWTAKDRLEFIAGQSPKFACNADFAYSDTNYILLGAIVEQVSGMEFYAYAESHIFKPLGIKPFVPVTGRKIDQLANGYATVQDPLGFTGPALDKEGKSRYNMQFEWTGGGYAYNPKQMAQLMVAIFEGKVFGHKLLEAYTATLPAPEIHAEYGLGIIKYEMNGKTYYGHSGFFPGYIAMVYYDPEKQCSFVFQINTTEKTGIKKLTEGVKMLLSAKS